MSWNSSSGQKLPGGLRVKRDHALVPSESREGGSMSRSIRDMALTDPTPTVRIARHPIHPMLVPIPIACFVGTLITDIVYWRTAEMIWANFSAWLVTVGVIFGVIAAVIGLI